MATWIFQGNPNTFDIDGYLRATAVITWTVRQQHLAERIAAGDRVFIWRAQGGGKESAGIIAAGYILEGPREMQDDPQSKPFWRKPAEGDDLRVRIRIERHATSAKEVIRRDWLKDDPILAGLRILRMASETNYPVEPEHARRIEALWRNTGRDWSAEESIAGLWAYARTSGGEVSRKPGSPVAEVALRVGRAVTGVYNKVMNFRHIDPRDARAGLSGAGETDWKVWETFFDPKVQHLDTARLGEEYSRLWPPNSDAALDVVPAETGPAGVGAAGAGAVVTREAPRAHGQGHESDPAVRRAIEQRAMELATKHYQAFGFEVENTSDRQPYDLRCMRAGMEVRVEVKGTRGDGRTIELTIGEIKNAHGMGWRTDLFVVAGIEVVRMDGRIHASGGSAGITESWRPAEADLSPVRFRYVVPLPSAPTDLPDQG